MRGLNALTLSGDYKCEGKYKLSTWDNHILLDEKNHLQR